MSIKIGDKVRFLNDVGGGTVVGFNGPHEVMIEQEDGFEIPSPVSECVVVEQQAAPQKPSNDSPKSSSTVASVGVDRSTIVSSRSNTNVDRLDLYLSFVPTDIEQIDRCSTKIYLINDSQYSLFFSLLSGEKDGSYRSLYNSTVSPNQRLFIEEISKPSLQQIEHLRAQVVALKGMGSFKLHAPIDRNINIKLTKFYKSSSFTHSGFLGCEAMTIELSKEQVNDIEALKQALSETIPQPKSTAEPKKISKPNPSLLEVDLHIEKLLDSTSGMSSGDILEYQLDHFRSVISKNSRFTGQKIIFIHGKGDGVLRNAIIRELKRMGRGDRYQEASFKRYGFGALMVTM